MTDKKEKKDIIDILEQIDQADKTEHIDKTDQADKTEHIDKTDQADKTDQTDKTDQADKTDQIDKIDQIDENDVIDQVDEISKSDQIDKKDIIDKNNTDKKSENKKAVDNTNKKKTDKKKKKKRPQRRLSDKKGFPFLPMGNKRGKAPGVLKNDAGGEAPGVPVEELPSSELLEKELTREKYRSRFFTTMRSTVFGLITVAAMAVLVAILFLPVLHIYGQSMNGTLDNGDIVLSLKNSSMGTGEIIAFYYNNNILVKRVIANSGEWVDIDQDGNVYVNQKRIEEPYLHEPKAYGETDIELPYQVPEGKVFVMGDNREVSIDSRNTAVGCVDQEQVVGHIVFRVWPFSKIGFVN